MLGNGQRSGQRKARRGNVRHQEGSSTVPPLTVYDRCMTTKPAPGAMTRYAILLLDGWLFYIAYIARCLPAGGRTPLY